MVEKVKDLTIVIKDKGQRRLRPTEEDLITLAISLFVTIKDPIPNKVTKRASTQLRQEHTIKRQANHWVSKHYCWVETGSGEQWGWVREDIDVVVDKEEGVVSGGGCYEGKSWEYREEGQEDWGAVCGVGVG